MYSQEELEKLVSEIAGNAHRSQKTVEVEAVIAQMKADILKEVNERIGMLTMIDIMGKSGEPKSAPIWANEHVAFYIAEAAEKIMRRAWIDKK